MATKLYIRSGLSPALWGTTSFSQERFSMKDAGRGVTPGAELFEGSISVEALNATVGTGTGFASSRTSIAGPTDGIFVTTATNRPDIGISDPIAANITISGTVSFDICGSESNMNANATFRVALYRMDSEGALTLIVNSAGTAELGTSLTRISWTASPTSTDLVVGDRILMLTMFDDAASNMGSGHTLLMQDEGSAANVADTSITFTENLTFITSAPSGTSYYLRDTASDVSGLKVLSLTQGSGTATAVHTTLDGPLTYPGDQWTTTAGGANIGWITPSLNAFTLSEAVKVDLGAAASAELEAINASPFDAITVELAICDSDGSNPVVWARSYTSHVNLDGDTRTYYLTGPSTSVAQGKRLRVLVYSDDFRPYGNQVAGTDRTIRYDGTATYASALTFTQTITEGAAGPATSFVFPPVHPMLHLLVR